MSFIDQFSCPACGAAFEQVNAHTRSLSCPHCGNWVYFSNNSWMDGGKFAQQIEAPPFLHVERSGKLDGVSFTVSGRARLSYTGGFWDEWWLTFEDGSGRWLEEDDGAYHLHLEQAFSGSLDEAKNISVGQFFTAGGLNGFVTEAQQASIIGAEGQLPYNAAPGTTIGYFDAVADGKELSVEVWHDGVAASVSEPLSASRLVWD